MDIRQDHLPGVGTRFHLSTDRGERMMIVVRTDGQREIFLYRDGVEPSSHHIRLSDGEARTIGALLLGAYLPLDPPGSSG